MKALLSATGEIKLSLDTGAGLLERRLAGAAETARDEATQAEKAMEAVFQRYQERWPARHLARRGRRSIRVRRPGRVRA